jgi:hypothetical protein
MNLRVDDSYLIEDTTMLEAYMDEVRTRTIERLTLLELAALFEDLREFQIRLREERDLAYGEANYEE